MNFCGVSEHTWSSITDKLTSLLPTWPTNWSFNYSCYHWSLVFVTQFFSLIFFRMHIKQILWYTFTRELQNIITIYLLNRKLVCMNFSGRRETIFLNQLTDPCCGIINFLLLLISKLKWSVSYRTLIWCFQTLLNKTSKDEREEWK